MSSADAPDRTGGRAGAGTTACSAGRPPTTERAATPTPPGSPTPWRRASGWTGGAGSSTSAVGPARCPPAFAPLFEAVVGLDPDADMSPRPGAPRPRRGSAHASWVQLRAESLPDALGLFRVVSFAQSLHWMDRPRVAAAIRPMLEPGGSVVLVDQAGFEPDADPSHNTHPPVPEAAIDELRVRWLGPDRRAGAGFRNTSPGGEDDVFRAAGFGPRRRWLCRTGAPSTQASAGSSPGPLEPVDRAPSLRRASPSSSASFAASCLAPRPRVASPCGCRTTACGSGGRRRSAGVGGTPRHRFPGRGLRY